MRIISGNFKNKKLFQPNDNCTRPLKDLVKESIFNIIEHSKLIKFKIENCKVLDLFSGSGSFGLECISRGAKKVLFCENYIPVTKILNKNIANLKCKEKTDIYVEDIFKLSNNKSFLKNKFQIIFLDPPFKEKKIKELLENLNKSNILDKKGIVILHRNKKYKDILPEKFKVELEKNYGLSKIIFGSF
jgi:16S rRNA (guanine966-N2)-methyltransferase